MIESAKKAYESGKHLCDTCINYVVQERATTSKRYGNDEFDTEKIVACKSNLSTEEKVVKCSEYLFFERKI